MAHIIGYRILTLDDEAWFRLNDPENGLHDEDVKAFRESIRGPVKGGIVASFWAWFKFWEVRDSERVGASPFPRK
jgi:hypothetical protein